MTMRITPLETRQGIGFYRVDDARVTLMIRDSKAHCANCRSNDCVHTNALLNALTLSRTEHDNGL